MKARAVKDEGGQLPSLREVQRLVRGHVSRHVLAWKQAGRPVVGTFCRYVPREVILAAGALPLRLRGAGSEDSSPGDAYLSGRTCTYVRHVMSLVLEGKYDFLDGEVSLNTCDHVRRAADLFVKKTSIPFHGFISLPRAPREDLFAYYLGELRGLLEGLERHLGTRVTADDLRQAIRTMNDIRRRLTTMDELRLRDRPKLSGAEALAVHIASQTLPPAVFIELADRVLDAVGRRPGLDSPAGRLVLLGAELDEPAFVEAVESQGALVVADGLCFGSRAATGPIDEFAPDPLEAIGRAYFFGPSCGRMMGDFPNRWNDLVRMLERARADGVIMERIVFCDPWGADVHNIMHRLKAQPVFPFLALSREYGVVPTGQIKTRVQAFLERIEMDRARRGRQGGGS
jgi:benzoyl-CoA reductase/2-hydroxyglutaryl-CoA dehydratase subunit BcrC/BadD/HgdB